ncbi:hypothetical protein DL95DRAFT_512135 [Leptodontidium sp. 2 PMI_412]|nr:hypothetical protein DL95DRAFT_512135 [Leptodontidium sp. 2 PMI_412]
MDPVAIHMGHHDSQLEQSLEVAGVPPMPGNPADALVGESIVLQSQAVIVPPAGQYSPHEWEAKRQIIRKLFIEDNQTCREVLDSLAPQFTPTVKMLKIMLKQWGYTKNNALNDLRAMVFRRRERRKLKKATLFFKNGRLVDVDGALKRKGMSEITLEVNSTFPLPSNVVVQTPSPPPSFIAAPTEIKIQEDILTIYKVLLEQWQKTSSSTTMDDYGFSLSSRIEKPCVYHEMGHALSCANLAFDASYSDLGGSLLKQAFLLAESVVRMESPEWLLVSPWQHLHQARRPGIAKLLICHFHNLSRTFLPNGLVHRFFDSLVAATESQPLDRFIKTLTPGLMRILESAPDEILLARTAVELLEGEDKSNQTIGLVSQIDNRIRKWQSQMDKRSPSRLMADLDVQHLRLELTRQSGDGWRLIDCSRDFLA